MGRKKQPPKDDEKQSARFIETAERTECDKEVFEKACKAIIKPKVETARKSPDYPK